MITTAIRRKVVENVIDHAKTGAMFRQEREMHHLTLREFSKRIGVSSSFLSDLERGRRNWSDEMVAKCWKELSVT